MVDENSTDFSMTGVILAHRAWRYSFEHDKDGRAIFRSVSSRIPWRSIEITATCDRCVEESPNEKCGCGIYCLKNPKELLNHISFGNEWITYSSYGRPHINMFIFGTVAIWGRIIEGAGGYRAQHARIDSLVIPTSKLVPTHLYYTEKNKTVWVPIELHLDKLADELHKSYNVPVFQDTEELYYTKMHSPSERELESASPVRNRVKGKPVVPMYDTSTKRVYKSKTAVGKALAAEYGYDQNDRWVWYKILKDDPYRFREATLKEVTSWKAAHYGGW